MQLFDSDDSTAVTEEVPFTSLTAAHAPHEIPADVRLLAAVARLLDFHQSRSGASVSIPETPESAGRNLYLATGLLQTLGRLEIENGQSRVSIKALSAELVSDIGPITQEELNFCVASLATAREIRYAVLNDDRKIVQARTSDTTTLVAFDPSLRQVSLTDNARLLLRVTSLKESWLYSDVDAQRLIKAIQHGQFHDVPRFCREMVRDLAGKARQIADVCERPTLADVRDALITDGAKISATLGDAAQVVQSAMTLLFSEQTEAQFALWRASRGVTFSIGNLQAELETVLQSTESLSRRFVKFVKDAQRTQTVRPPVMRFLDMGRSLTVREDGAAKQIEAAMADVLPWTHTVRFFSPELLSGQIDLSSLLNEDERIPTPVSFETVGDGLAAEGPVHEFLRRNAATIISALEAGPLPFSELIDVATLEFHPGETVADLVGAFTYPQIFDSGGVSVRIGYRHASFKRDSHSAVFLTSDPVLSLHESAAK